MDGGNGAGWWQPAGPDSGGQPLWKVSAPIGDGTQVVTGLTAPLWKVSAPIGEGTQVVTGLLLLIVIGLLGLPSG